MFQLRLFYDKHNEKTDAIAIKYSNCNKETGPYLKDTLLEEMINKFVLNVILHHVGMSWIISSKNEMLYKIEESNHPYWLNKVPWYNTAICSKFHGKLFEDFIIHGRTDRYQLMCSIISHN